MLSWSLHSVNWQGCFLINDWVQTTEKLTCKWTKGDNNWQHLKLFIEKRHFKDIDQTESIDEALKKAKIADNLEGMNHSESEDKNDNSSQ